MTEETTTTTEPVTTNEPITGDITPPSFEDFTGAMPEGLRESLNKNGVKDFDTFEKSYNGLNEALGKKGLLKPGEGADEQVMEAYQRQLKEHIGVPENGEYTFDIPETFDQESGITQEFMDGLAKWAYEGNVGGNQFQGVVDHLGGALGKMSAMAAEQFGTEDGLKEEWGDKFDANTKAAETFIENNLPEGKALMKLPIFKKLAVELASRTGEDSIDSGEVSESNAQALQEQIDDVYKQQQDAIRVNDYTAQANLQAKAQELIAQQLKYKTA